MGRISREVIERVCREISIERVVTSYGVVLEAAGDRLVGRCPIHGGDDATLIIEPATNSWSCGPCERSGSVIDLVRAAQGVSTTHAVELLQAGLPENTPARPVKESTVRVLSSPIDAQADDAELLRQIVAYYVAELKQSTEALAYLEERGLNGEAIDEFKLGFSNRTLGYRLPTKERKPGRVIRSRLQRLGIVRESGHELFRGSLIIPVLNERGEVVQLHGRKITPNLRPGTQLHTSLPGEIRGVWNWRALATSTTVILSQSLIDALSIWCAGFRNVTAIPGLDASSDEHLDSFKRHSVKKVLVAFRRDNAGDTAALAFAEKLNAVGIGCHRVLFPAGMDANDFARKNPPASRSFDQAFRNAVWIGRGANHEDEHEATPSVVITPILLDQSPAADASRSTEFPAPTMPEVPTDANDIEVVLRLGDRRYRVRGLSKNLSYDSLRVNLLASRPTVEQTGFHVDSFELYQSKARAAFIKQAALELGVAEDVIKHDLGRVLLKLETLQEEQIRDALKPKAPEVSIEPHERDAAMALLMDPKLLDRVLLDFNRCGVIGEESNKLVGYLAATSRKLDDPLAVLIQSSSAAGKTSLMDAVLSFIPEEDRVHFSAMTGQSLFYFGEASLTHKILAVAEEEGAERASYALKLLQSEKHISIASTAKEPTTGRLVTQEYRVDGPTQLMLTTTAIDIDEELQNRCIVLTVDENREQTRAIHQLQRERETLEGLLAKTDRAAILKLHQNAQRLLRPLLVVNPFARELSFTDDRTRTRRDHLKYLGLIRAVALLHQYQRPLKSITHDSKTIQFIEVTPDDLVIANRLAHDVLGRSLDELPPQTRKLLLELDRVVKAQTANLNVARHDYRFTRRFVRDELGWGDTQLKVHLQRLVDLEYVLVHRAPHGRSRVYELLYDGAGKDGAPFLTGLLDATKLAYDGERSGVEADRSGLGRPSVGPWSGGGRGAENGENAIQSNDLNVATPPAAENARPGNVSARTSYPKIEGE